MVDQVLALIDTKLNEQHNINADRIYALGHSMGGMGAFTAIYQHPDRFAAAIPSAGVFLPGLTPNAFNMCRFGSFTANQTEWLTMWGRGMYSIRRGELGTGTK